MDSKINYLKKYHRDVELVQDGFDDIEHLPTSWKMLLNLNSITDKINIVMQMWDEVVGKCLNNTILYLKKNLKNVELITYSGKYSMLYSVASTNGEILYYEGGNPLAYQLTKELGNYWEKFPKAVQNFYKNLHDGFYYYASGSMGLYSQCDILYLGEEDWEIMEKGEDALKIQLESAFGFFGNGMGVYVVIDALNCKNDNATLWYTTKLPRYNIKFWDVIDEWIVE